MQRENKKEIKGGQLLFFGGKDIGTLSSKTDP